MANGIDRSGDLVTGAATLKPDAYYVEKQSQNGPEFTVTSAAAQPALKRLGNVVTDRVGQERALTNALKVARFDHPVQSFVARPPRFLRVSYSGKAYIGRTFSSFPTVYGQTSPSWPPQVVDEITVYP